MAQDRGGRYPMNEGDKAEGRDPAGERFPKFSGSSMVARCNGLLQILVTEIASGLTSLIFSGRLALEPFTSLTVTPLLVTPNFREFLFRVLR